MSSSPELDAERAFVAGLYGRLDELRDRASSQLVGVRTAPAEGTHQWRSERDALARAFEDRVAQLEVGDLPLCFGRLDFAGGNRFHVGRLALAADDHEPLLVDWRAPAAAPFYQATPGDPRGVVLRRRLLTEGREVTGLDDEVFDLASLSEEEQAGLQGDAALLAALTKSRTGRMGDIVATIQADQDRIVRSDLSGVLVVEGGPGTGKTAVALHRAAYLLYTYRRRLAGMGVLIVGPNPTFVRYIDQVLPSLGETTALLVSVGELFPGIRAQREDPPAVARLKGDPRMVNVLRRAIEDRQRVPATDVTIFFEGVQLRLTRADALRIRSRGRRSRRPHNGARWSIEEAVLNVLVAQLPEEVLALFEPDEELANHQGPAGNGVADDRAVAAARRQLRRTRAFKELMERLWPVLTPQELLNDLFGFAALLRSAAPQLSEAERSLLLRPRRPRGVGVDWSVEDVPLIDEAAELLGEQERPGRSSARARRRRREVAYAREVLKNLNLSVNLSAEDLADRWAEGEDLEPLTVRAGRDRTWEFGHVIVDEAQELSPMAWRVVFRRCPARSMTIVGDLAQSGGPWRMRTWTEVFDRHARGRWRTAGLSINYRTPAEVMDLAKAVLAVTDPGAVAPEAMRMSGEQPWSKAVAGGSDLPAAVAGAVGSELSLVGEGRVAVLVPVSWRAGVTAALAEALPEAVEGGALEARVPVLTVRESKGLEFDSVVVVDPGAIASESEAGRRDLYVAITRTTRRLGVVYPEGGLPAEMEGLTVPL